MLYTLAASQETTSSMPRRSRFLAAATLCIAGSAVAYALLPAQHAALTTPVGSPIVEADARLVLAAAQQGYLGVNVRDVDAEHAQKEKLSSAIGAQVISLDHDAPAAKAGVHMGDIIQALNGQPVTDSATLTRLLRDMPVGKFVDMQIVHNGKIQQIHLQLADRTALVHNAWSHHFRVPLPESAPTISAFAGQRSFIGGRAATASPDSPDAQAYVGAEVEPLTPQLARFFGVHAGNGLLVRSVEDKSPAANAGIEAGDVILNANGQVLETTADWLQALRNSAGRPVAINVLRSRKVLTLAITVDARITQSDYVLPHELEQLRRSLERYSL